MHYTYVYRLFGLHFVIRHIFVPLDTTKSYNTDTIAELMELPKLSFMDFWVHDFPPLDISQKKFTNFSIPPLVWMETTTVPTEMTVKNIGHMRNKTILLSNK